VRGRIIAFTNETSAAIVRQIYEYHPVIGFRFVPETRARVPHEGGGYLVRTNESGFRCDHPFERRRKEGTRRILLFGDSFTAGEGVSNGYRYGDHLERILPDLQVYNFGLPATGLDQHYLVYREYAQDIDHDLLVIAVFVENIRRVGSRYRYFANEAGERVLYAKPFYTLREGKLELRGVPPDKRPVDPAELSAQDRQYISVVERFPGLKRLLNRLKRSRRFDNLVIRSGLKDRVLATLRYQPIKDYENSSNPAWLVMRALIAQWIGGHTKPVMLVPIPMYHYVCGISSPRTYQARLRSATEAAGGTFHDPLPLLLQHAPDVRRSFYFPNDGHLTRTGHEALAKAVAPAISALLGKRQAP
jgi:lysophospholipase L1-like esterase